MSASRLDRMDALVKELSRQDDPERLIQVFNDRADLFMPRDGLVTLSCRDLSPPWYRITRSHCWSEPPNPWTETERLPLLDHGLLGELLYAARPLIINDLVF